MLKISNKTLPPVAAVIIPMGIKLPQLYIARSAVISHMSGYPVAIHAIGRLQNMFKLTSYNDLLSSIIKIREIATLTAHVIDSMEGVKVDKYQMNKTEIAAYVAGVTMNLKGTAPSMDDVELISHLITSYEASTSSWILQGGEEEADLHLKMKDLYKNVTIDTDAADFPIYAGHSDTIVPLGSLPQFSTKGTGKATKQPAPLDYRSDALHNASVIYRFAGVRILDHIYQLMMDKDIWYSFIAPRAKAEIASNLERSKSLKTLALYCQSILSYNQFFTLELFMKSYDMVQSWLTHFPPLEASTLFKLDSVVRPHDLLDAKEDVASLVKSFSDASGQVLAKKLVVFPTETLANFGIAKSIEAAIIASSSYAIVGALDNIDKLDDARYLPLISGVASGELNVTHDLATTILIGKRVSGEIDAALTGLVPSLTRGASKATIETFKNLNVKAKLDFSIPHALTWAVTKGVEKGIENGKLLLDSASPVFSWEYHEFVRKALRFKMITDDQISKTYPRFANRQLFDRDRAASLRQILGYEWKTLVPAHQASGATVYSEKMLASSKEVVRHLIESLTGINFEIAIREMQVPHLRKIWATYLSSFALLYVDEQAAFGTGINDVVDISTLSLQLQEGHGRPYGTSYTLLEAAQGLLDSETVLIPIKAGIYMRVIKKLPVALDELHVLQDFFAQHPVMYYGSNSVTEEAEQWVLDDGLVNFAYFPTFDAAAVPSVMFTSRYAYVTHGLFLNIDMYYRPVSPDSAREVYSLNLEKKEWPFERFKFFLDYITFGPYAKPVVQGLPDAEEALVADAVKKIEAVMTTDVKEAAHSAEQAGPAADQAVKNVAREIKDSHSNDNRTAVDDKPADLDGSVK